MKYCRIYPYLLLLHFLIEDVKTINITSEKVQRIYPKGFRISIPYEKPFDVTFVQFYVNVDRPMGTSSQGPDFTATIKETTDGHWVYDNINSRVQVGTTIYYFLGTDPSFGRARAAYGRLRSAVLSEDTIVLLNKEMCEDFVARQTNCIHSVTTVNRKPVCKGALIFEENFNILNLTMWKKEVRIPFGNEGSPFVSYSGRSENCYVDKGQLHIIPTLLSDVPGFNESMIRTGSLQLPDCTPIDDDSKECERKAQFAQILPPIVSAKIHTKDSFSFRYGRIVIRARMPKGDWVVPLILLDPLENYYGYTGYASGQWRLVYVFGNELLRNNNGTDISRKRMRGGPLLSTRSPLNDHLLQEYFHEDYDFNDFHTYSFTWTETFMKIEIDDKLAVNEIIMQNFSEIGSDYKLPHARRWNNGRAMAPFDREFFLTLGLSIGGHEYFPDGCRNGADLREKPWKNYDPKAESNFWKDKNNWIKTWNEVDIGLHIDFIRVYAI